MRSRSLREIAIAWNRRRFRHATGAAYRLLTLRARETRVKKGLVGVGILAVLGCGEAPAEHAEPVVPAASPADVTTPFDAEYRAAAEELGVPFELLRAVGAAQTGHHRVDVAHSHSGQAGVMGLQPAAVAEAARLLGVDESVVERDDLANVRGAAAILADRRLRGATWNEAALDLSGIEHPPLRARWLQKLGRHLAKVGEPVPSVPEDMLSSAATAAGEYPASSFVAAYGGNYTNASRGTGAVSYVVIHDVEGSYEGCISWFQNPSANVSAHYVIANEGDITQMVWEQDIAWHAGNWSYNEQSVGIEHEGYASDPSSYPETMYVASAGLTRYLTDKYSIPRSRSYIIAHAQVPGSSHTDPGPYWDWDHYMELVESGGVAVKSRLVGYVREGDIYEGFPIAGATIELDNGRTTTSDADGYYEIDDLEPGLYTVTATAPGYDEGVDEKDLESPGNTYWKSFALVASSSGDDDDDGEPFPEGNKAHGRGGAGCSMTPGSTGSIAPFALAALALLVTRRRR